MGNAQENEASLLDYGSLYHYPASVTIVTTHTIAAVAWDDILTSSLASHRRSKTRAPRCTAHTPASSPHPPTLSPLHPLHPHPLPPSVAPWGRYPPTTASAQWGHYSHSPVSTVASRGHWGCLGVAGACVVGRTVVVIETGIAATQMTAATSVLVLPSGCWWEKLWWHRNRCLCTCIIYNLWTYHRQASSTQQQHLKGYHFEWTTPSDELVKPYFINYGFTIVFAIPWKRHDTTMIPW